VVGIAPTLGESRYPADHQRADPGEFMNRPSKTHVAESSVERARIAARAADDKQGNDVLVLDVGDIIGIVEFFVVTSASNTRLVRTIVDEVERQVFERAAVKPRAVEGLDDMSWVLVDYGDIVVHVFLEETREFYGLERLWADAARVAWNDAEAV
jgi:ribosome-associated protein